MKPQTKNWNEIELAIAAVAVTATLGFWNLFSTPNPSANSAQVSQVSNPPPPPTDPAPATLPGLPLRPVKIIYGAQAPQQQVSQVIVPAGTPTTVITTTAPQVIISKPAPAKHAKTGSSKP